MLRQIYRDQKCFIIQEFFAFLLALFLLLFMSTVLLETRLGKKVQPPWRRVIHTTSSRIILKSMVDVTISFTFYLEHK